MIGKLYRTEKHTPKDRQSVGVGAHLTCDLPHTGAYGSWTYTAGWGTLSVRLKANQTALWRPSGSEVGVVKDYSCSPSHLERQRPKPEMAVRQEH